ncbi:LOW QUALITY PROTEIN: hypothetical protein U9M48_013454 [Paspalum notatum var. saurae]|uniref:Reverse transcriptase domain-containing protein n=1 Tax=Paspalum notatum var. saurae TaxID=547442 RepID=A0AAQ3SZZ3_PASNO
MPLDKALGPDGFTGRFYCSCWDIIKGDVILALNAIHSGHVYRFRLSNSAFITLLPKKGDAVLVKDCRPISLIHSFAKLVTKILANRLAPLLPDLVSNNQSAFVRGRSIHDNFMLVQQLARNLHRSKEPHVLLKLDISKAFDSVSWSFLLEVLQQLGFGRRWQDLLGPPISHLCGLRQGEPLSLMLFILVMDVLNSLVRKACEENLLLPIAGQQNLNLHRISLTNLIKSSATPIQCSDEDVVLTSEVIKAIDKRRRGFLWKGQEQANGGNCLVSWERVQRPLCYGGLGVHDLDRLGCALRIWWLWLQKTDGSRPWAGLPVQVPLKARALFNMAVATRVGNGVSTFFWTDWWLEDKTVAELAPNLFSLIPKGIVKRRTVSQALSNRRWVEDIRGALTIQVLLEYLAIWDMVDALVLQHDVPDQHVWKLPTSGSYSNKSAYNAMFVGTIKFFPWRRLWKSWAPPKCKFFMWLAINNQCWTSDQLARHGLPHLPACPICDQAEETIHHILGSCVLAREVWVEVLRRLQLTALKPLNPSCKFFSWWSQSSKALPKDLRKGFNTLFILVSWEIWKHRNDCGARPVVQAMLNSVGAEGHEWCLAVN